MKPSTFWFLQNTCWFPSNWPVFAQILMRPPAKSRRWRTLVAVYAFLAQEIEPIPRESARLIRWATNSREFAVTDGLFLGVENSATGRRLARPARPARLSARARHRAAPRSPGTAGAHSGRAEYRSRCGRSLPRSDREAIDARSQCAYRACRRRPLASPTRSYAARPSQSSATMTSTAQRRPRCWHAFCARRASSL